MNISLAQINPTIGDITGNLKKISDALNTRTLDTDLIIFPELALCGYPPKDLLEKPWFMDSIESSHADLLQLSKQHPEQGILIGLPTRHTDKHGRGIYNSAQLIQNGNILFQQNKQLLPSYDVFDETRYFDSAHTQHVFKFKGETLGITICEDIWSDHNFWTKPLYDQDPVQNLLTQGATLLINLAASPFEINKEQLRQELVRSHIKRCKTPFVLVNQVGGNDDLIFDGHSFAMNAQGDLIAQCQSFETDLQTCDTKSEHIIKPQTHNPLELMYNALVLGVRDYFKKCGATQAIIGLSGGIDSALVAAIAVDALGPKQVLGISMPTRYSSTGSVTDSEQLASHLKMDCKTIPIHSILDSYEQVFNVEFDGLPSDTTEENIQARIRGNILMAFSNKQGRLLLTTGNKSEVAVGYCTLYGDMCGGLAVISDVPKTIVYELSRWINRHTEIIPQAIIDKEPSAELRPDQKDQDSLPPYPILDAILDLFLDKHLSVQDIIKQGYHKETVEWITRTVNHNEYKRRQMPPGLKVTSKAFGSGRRFPIAAKY